MARNVKTVSFSLPHELAEALERGAASVGISRSSYLTALLHTVHLTDEEKRDLADIFRNGQTHAVRRPE